MMRKESAYMKQLGKLKVCWFYLGIIFLCPTVFFAVGEYAMLILIFLAYLFPVLGVLLMWGSYVVGKQVERNFHWKFRWNILFSLIMATLVGSSFGIVGDIFNSIKEQRFLLRSVWEFISAPFRSDITTSGSEIEYIEFGMAFAAMIVGFLVQKFWKKTEENGG